MLNDKRKFERSVRCFPWYYGLSSDLIFFIAINTVWLIEVKGFSDVQMNLLTAVSSLTALLFIYPMLKLTKKIGITSSIRVGAFCLLLSSVMFTYCNDFIYFIIGNIIYQLSFLFAMMSVIVLKNNLDYLGKEEKYIEIRSKGSLIYAILTAVATITCGYLFNFNKYLPMILGIFLCVMCFLFSLFVEDSSSDTPEEKIKQDKAKLKKQWKIILLIVCYYGIAFSLVLSSQQNGKLLIQSTLLEEISIEKIAVYLSYIMFLSRIMRILGNMIFPKLYKKIGNKIGVLVISVLLFDCIMIACGAFINLSVYLRAIIISFGFLFVPMLVDLLQIFSQNLVFEKFDKEYQEDVFAYMTFGRNAFNFILSLIISAVLLNLNLGYLFVVFIILILPLFVLIFKILKR